MKILNLYAGIGGNRKLWGDQHSITAVEFNEEIANIYKNNFSKDTVIIGDAHQYLLEHVKEFDFIWTSPPCQTHSTLTAMRVHGNISKPLYIDLKLYQEIILLKYFSAKKCKWVVENVNPYYNTLIKPMVILERHLFWTNFYVRTKSFNSFKDINSIKKNDTVYGFNLREKKIEHDKVQILKNLVNPEIGLYLFEQAQKGQKPLFNFDY
jgi:DNA (cytosine-5)-methyltransferase 1